MKLPYVALAAFFAACVVGCGGGGGGSTASNSGGGAAVLPTPNSGATSGSATQSVTLAIIIPKNVTAASNSRRAQYIPSNTASMSLTLVSVNGVATSGITQGPFNLTAPSATNVNPACTIVAAGTSCTFSIAAPTGTDIFTATTFSDAKGTVPLGSGSIAFAVLQNASNVANLTLAGPVASVSLLSSTTGLNNGNPVAPTSAPSYLPAIARNNAPQSGTRRAPAASSVTPAPLPTAATSARIFVIALDAAGNQIINPTTFDIPINVVLSLNGLKAGVVALNVTYAGLSTQDSGTFATSADGSSIPVYSPSDQVTLTFGSQTATGTFAPSLQAQYTPQGGSQQTSTALTYVVNGNPPGPSDGVTATHGSFFTGVPGPLTVTVTNGGDGPTATGTVVQGTISYGTIANFTGTNSSYWNCSVTSTNPPYGDSYSCSVVGSTIPANTTAPPITINVTSSYPSFTHYVYYDDATNISLADTIPVSSGPAPSPTPYLYDAPQLSYTGNVANFYGGVPGDGYTNTLTNDGSVATSGTITLTNTLDANLTYTNYAGTGWTCSAASHVVTCTSTTSIPANSSAAPVTIFVTPSVGASGYQVTNSYSISGGGGANGGGSSFSTNVDYALQFVSSSFNTNADPFYAGPSINAGTGIGLLDFGGPPSPTNGTISLVSYIPGTTSVAFGSDGCGAIISNAFDAQFPVNATYTIPVSLQVNVTGTTSVAPCPIVLTGADGTSVTLDMQMEYSTINVSGRSRK